jgi:protease PrsW
VYGRRLSYDVRPPVVLAAAFLGGIIGTVVAGTLEFDAQRTSASCPWWASA